MYDCPPAVFRIFIICIFLVLYLCRHMWGPGTPVTLCMQFSFLASNCVWSKTSWNRIENSVALRNVPKEISGTKAWHLLPTTAWEESIGFILIAPHSTSKEETNNWKSHRRVELGNIKRWVSTEFKTRSPHDIFSFFFLQILTSSFWEEVAFLNKLSFQLIWCALEDQVGVWERVTKFH